MKQRFDDTVSAGLGAWVRWVVAHVRWVVAVEVLVTGALAVVAVSRLGVNMDHRRLLDPDLPFQVSAAAFGRYFPQLDDALLVVIDADGPETARQAARTLARRLREDRARFRDVYVPGADPFFLRRGLLYRTPEELDDFADQLARLQPVIADLSRDASVANLARLVRLGLEQERTSGRGEEDWARMLDRIGTATVRVFDEYPVSLSWERLMLEGSAFDPGVRQVVIAEPVLHFDKVLAAKDAIAAIREGARALSLTPDRGVRVRITGNPALNYEEMLGLGWDVGAASIVSFAVVTWVLAVAFRSLRLVAASALTLLAGLIWTAGFAAVSVGDLNILSIAFGVLFIGLGVDFGIHLGMQYADAIRHGARTPVALEAAMERVGGSLALCALTTAIGFFVFLPTDYRGVAELGLIAGMGMLIILFQTVTLLPALVTVLLGDRPQEFVRPPYHFRLAPPEIVSRHPRAVALASLVIGAVALAQLPRVRFDSNVIKLRDARTESVQAFNDLLADALTTPWYVDVLTPNLDRAERLGKRLGRLDVVKTALTVRDYVPPDQDEKLEILGDAALLLDLPGGLNASATGVAVGEQVQALRDLHGALGVAWLRKESSPLAASARRLREEIGRFLARVAAAEDPGAAIADLERVLFGNFPEQVERLRRALDPPRIELADLPAALSSRMLAPDGHARVQVFPREDLSETAALERFVDAVRAVAPGATGVAVNILEFGRATSRSMGQALLSATVAIALLLYALWRRVAEMLYVMAPLFLAAVVLGALTVWLDLEFNFANIVVLPLLLGMGVDSGIHLVHRSHVADEESGGLLETTTARAVFFSAVTTIVSFGSLAFSAHRGIASLGTLLVCGMVVTLASNLIVLPALIALRPRAEAGGR